MNCKSIINDVQNTLSRKGNPTQPIGQYNCKENHETDFKYQEPSNSSEDRRLLRMSFY